MISTAEEFVRLRNSEVPEEYGLAVSSPVSEAVWLDVIRYYPELKFWVAHNKTVPMSILRILADDADTRVRASVASKRKLDAELFEKLASDPDASVRNTVACNSQSPLAIIRILAQDPCEFVRKNAQQRLGSSP